MNKLKEKFCNKVIKSKRPRAETNTQRNPLIVVYSKGSGQDASASSCILEDRQAFVHQNVTFIR